jgi:hypothetical protein
VGTLVRIVARPLRDWLDALNARVGSRVDLLVVLAALVLSWWIYVPLHELAHAWGCLAAGGVVTRLEIDWIYGASLLARVFPYVTVGSAYAGQLTGFDTRGSDLVYLATDAAPFLLTVLVGVPALRAASRGAGRWRCALLGASLPAAYAPFVSLTGDYYEMGSILVSRAVAAFAPHTSITRWRGDDVFKLIGDLVPRASAGDVMAVTASLLVGTALAFATYWAGLAVAAAMTARNS